MSDEIKNVTALVTGASSGLGVDFARELASRGANLVLVARREEAMRKLAAALEEQYGVSVLVIPMDLTAPDAPQSLYDQLKEQGVAVDILINNAGFGLYGQFVNIGWEQEQSMLQLDIVAVVHLTKLFVRDMLARKKGYVMLLGSIGAYQPSPTYASYSAAKAFILSLGEALNYELRGSGVSVTVLSPGVTATEFFKVADQEPSLYQRLTMMKSPDVVRFGVRAMLRRRASVVPGFLNAFLAFGTRLIPRTWQAAVVHALMTVK